MPIGRARVGMRGSSRRDASASPQPRRPTPHMLPRCSRFSVAQAETVIEPFIALPWIPQWYAYVPGAMKVIAPLLPWARVAVAHVASLSSTTLCCAASLFVQPIVSPALAATGFGANLKPAIVAATVALPVDGRQAVPAALPGGPALPPPVPLVQAARASDASVTRMNRMARCI